MEGFPLAGESFPAVTIEEAMKFSPAPCLIYFGTQAPMAVFTHGDKKYYHFMQESAQTQAMESKEARKYMATEARKARQTVVIEARRLLNEPEFTPIAQERSLQPAKNRGHSRELVAGLSTKALVVMVTLRSLLNKLVAGTMSLAIAPKMSGRR